LSPSTNGRIRVSWTPAAEPTNSSFNYVIACGTTMRSYGSLKLLSTVGKNGSTSPIARASVDWSLVTHQNLSSSPFALYSAWAASNAALQAQIDLLEPATLSDLSNRVSQVESDLAAIPPTPGSRITVGGTNYTPAAGSVTLPAIAGPTGPQGPAGSNGVDGAVGPQGPQGPAGTNTVTGDHQSLTNRPGDAEGYHLSASNFLRIAAMFYGSYFNTNALRAINVSLGAIYDEDGVERISVLDGYMNDWDDVLAVHWQQRYLGRAGSGASVFSWANGPQFPSLTTDGFLRLTGSTGAVSVVEAANMLAAIGAQPTNAYLTTLAAGTATPILGTTSTKAAAGDHAHSGTYQPADADLDDLADGSLTGSKVGSGIPAGNITTGNIGVDRLTNAVADTVYDSSDSYRTPYTLTTAGTVTVTRAMGRLGYLKLTGAVTKFTFSATDFPTNCVGEFTLDLYKGAYTFGFDTTKITNSTLLDTTATTKDIPLFFRKPMNESVWRVGQ
jgi:hypothetical protein